MTQDTTTPAPAQGATVVQTADTTVTVDTEKTFTVPGMSVALPLPRWFPEPSIVTGVSAGLAVAILGTLFAFGLPLSPEMTARVMSGVASAATALCIIGVIIRMFVVPVGKAKAAIQTAYFAQPGVDPIPVVDNDLDPNAV